jgi:plasmid stabilization system protein ParE
MPDVPAGNLREEERSTLWHEKFDRLREKPKTGPHRATNHPGRPRHTPSKGVHLFYGRLLGSDKEILGSTAKPSRARVRRGAALHDVLAGTLVVEVEPPSAPPLCRQMAKAWLVVNTPTMLFPTPRRSVGLTALLVSASLSPHGSSFHVTRCRLSRATDSAG